MNELKTGVEKDFISIKEASILTGIQPQTLRKMGDQKKIQCYRTFSGQRKFHKGSLEDMCYSNGTIKPEIKPANQKQNFIYARVSNRNFSGSLAKQVSDILENNEKYKEYHKITDISLGTNYKRKGLQTILKECFQKTIGDVVITQKDSLCVIGYELLEQIIVGCGGKIVILKDDDENENLPDTVISEIINILQMYSTAKQKSQPQKYVEEEDINAVVA
jgi:predicted site-specific integrase-resolvase